MTQQQHFAVAVYLVDRAYGGPEEGGWWFDYAERQEDPKFAVRTRHFKSEEEAITYKRLLQRWLNVFWNRNRRSDIGSVLSEGRFDAIALEGHPPTHWPERRPHYE